MPAQDFLDSVPNEIAAKIIAVLDAVASAPPPSFSGGGKWEAMHGDMTGVHEVRVDGPKRTHYRMFCVLARNGKDFGLGGPSIVLIDGMEKPFRSKFSQSEYAAVRALIRELKASVPWSIAR